MKIMDVYIKPKISVNIDLFRKVHQFNLLPSEYIHTSWLKNTLAETLAFTSGLPPGMRAKRWLSSWIITHLCPGFIYDFSFPGRRLALLEHRTLCKLITLAGLCSIADCLSRTVDGESIRELKHALGRDSYDFAMKRAPLLIGGLHLPRMAMKNDLKLSEKAFRCGHKILEKIMAGAPKPLTDRLRLKFTRPTTWDFSQPAGEETRDICWRLMHKILITEVGPPWTTLFT